MAKDKGGGEERGFVVELNSGSDLKNVNFTDWAQRILLEGTIGNLKCANFVEDGVLELAGTEGVLRIDLSKQDLTEASRSWPSRTKRNGDSGGRVDLRLGVDRPLLRPASDTDNLNLSHDSAVSQVGLRQSGKHGFDEE